MAHHTIALALLAALLIGCSQPPTPAPPAQEPVAAQTPSPETVPAPPRTPSFPPLAAPARGPGRWFATGLGGLTIYDNNGRPALTRPDFKPRLLTGSPSGDRLLAAAADGQVLLVTPADGLTKALDLKTEQDPVAAWSPDGTQALYASYRGPIYLMDAAKGTAKEIPPFGPVVGLQFLSDNEALVLAHAGSGGAQAARLDLTTGKSTDMGFLFTHAVSPDGRQMATANYRGGQVTFTDLTTGKTQITQRDLPLAEPRPEVEITGGYRWFMNSWSPDSTTLAAILQEDGQPQMLRVIDPTGKQPELVVPDWDGSLTWTGRGADLVYGARTDGQLTVYINRARLSTHPDGVRVGLTTPEAILSPDGLKVAYAVELKDRRSVLTIADLTTGESTQLPDSQGLQPVLWTDDGGLLAAEYAFEREDLGGGAYAEGWTLKGVRTLPAWQPAQTAAVTQPLWGRPGTVVYGPDSDQPLTVNYAPFMYKGTTYYPVGSGSDIYLFRQKGDEAYLDGRFFHASALQVYDQPIFLYRLPLTLGARFSLPWEHHNFGYGLWPWEVSGFPKTDTVQLVSYSQQTQFWSPGLGPSTDGAIRVEHETPRNVPALATLEDGTTAIIVGGLHIETLAGETLLPAQEINIMRSQIWWAEAGAPSPVLLTYTHSQAEPNLTFRGFAYNASARRFEPLRFQMPGGQVKTILYGDLKSENGVLTLEDETAYPFRSVCRFRWTGDLMACDAYESGWKPDSEERFVWHFSKALDEANWVKLFVDPEKGRAAYKATRREEGRNSLMYARPTSNSDGSWMLGGIRITLVPYEGEWRVATWGE